MFWVCLAFIMGIAVGGVIKLPIVEENSRDLEIKRPIPQPPSYIRSVIKRPDRKCKCKCACKSNP